MILIFSQVCRKARKNRRKTTATETTIRRTNRTHFTCHGISTFSSKHPKSHHSMSSIWDTTPNTNGWSILVCTPELCTSCRRSTISTFRSRRRSISVWCGASWWFSFHCKRFQPDRHHTPRSIMFAAIIDFFLLQQTVDIADHSVFPQRGIDWRTIDVHRDGIDLSAHFDDYFNCGREYIGDGIGGGVC